MAGGYSPSLLVNGRQAVVCSMLLLAQLQHTGTEVPNKEGLPVNDARNGLSDKYGCQLGGGP